MTTIAPTVELTLIPRTEAFVLELDETINTLIPAAMARLNERGAESLRDAILMTTSHLDGHVRRLRQALSEGEPDSFSTEAALHGYMLMREAVLYWRDAAPGNRWPNNPEAN